MIRHSLGIRAYDFWKIGQQSTHSAHQYRLPNGAYEHTYPVSRHILNFVLNIVPPDSNFRILVKKTPRLFNPRLSRNFFCFSDDFRNRYSLFYPGTLKLTSALRDILASSRCLFRCFIGWEGLLIAFEGILTFHILQI